MSTLILETQHAEIAQRLNSSEWHCVVCLCAAWCSACERYRTVFDSLAERHPNVCFIWVDVEVHAHCVEEIEIEDFPTLWLEDAKGVRFWGTVLPHAHVVDQLLLHWNDLPYLNEPSLLEKLSLSARVISSGRSTT